MNKEVFGKFMTNSKVLWANSLDAIYLPEAENKSFQWFKDQAWTPPPPPTIQVLIEKGCQNLVWLAPNYTVISSVQEDALNQLVIY